MAQRQFLFGLLNTNFDYQNMRTLDQTIQGQVQDIKQRIEKNKTEGAPSSTIRQDVHEKAMLNMEHQIMHRLLKYLEELMSENLNPNSRGLLEELRKSSFVYKNIRAFDEQVRKCVDNINRSKPLKGI